MEHGPEHRVDERQMHPQYREREEVFRTAAARLWDEEQALRVRIRQNADLEEEQRLDAYREGYTTLEQRFSSLVEGFSRDVSARVLAAERPLFAVRNEHFAAMLAQAAQTPDDQLEALFNSARRAGLGDLEQAAAHVAYERDPLKRPKIFEEWAAANPQRAGAVELLRRTPGASQLYDRSERAMRPPKAAPDDLAPTKADLQAARDKAQREDTSRRAFFNRPSGVRRQVGRRIA
jgi:hypothetical protein